MVILRDMVMTMARMVVRVGLVILVAIIRVVVSMRVRMALIKALAGSY